MHQMIDYFFYIHLFGSLITLFILLKDKIIFNNIMLTIVLNMASLYILLLFPKTYFCVGIVFALIMGVAASSSPAFLSKNKIFKDLQDVVITVTMLIISSLFWMQFICINIFLYLKKSDQF